MSGAQDSQPPANGPGGSQPPEGANHIARSVTRLVRRTQRSLTPWAQRALEAEQAAPPPRAKTPRASQPAEPARDSRPGLVLAGGRTSRSAGPLQRAQLTTRISVVQRAAAPGRSAQALEQLADKVVRRIPTVAEKYERKPLGARPQRSGLPLPAANEPTASAPAQPAEARATAPEAPVERPAPAPEVTGTGESIVQRLNAMRLQAARRAAARREQEQEQPEQPRPPAQPFPAASSAAEAAQLSPRQASRMAAAAARAAGVGNEPTRVRRSSVEELTPQQRPPEPAAAVSRPVRPAERDVPARPAEPAPPASPAPSIQRTPEPDAPLPRQPHREADLPEPPQPRGEQPQSKAQSPERPQAQAQIQPPAATEEPLPLRRRQAQPLEPAASAAEPPAIQRTARPGLEPEPDSEPTPAASPQPPQPATASPAPRAEAEDQPEPPAATPPAAPPAAVQRQVAPAADEPSLPLRAAIPPPQRETARPTETAAPPEPPAVQRSPSPSEPREALHPAQTRPEPAPDPAAQTPQPFRAEAPPIEPPMEPPSIQRSIAPSDEALPLRTPPRAPARPATSETLPPEPDAVERREAAPAPTAPPAIQRAAASVEPADAPPAARAAAEAEVEPSAPLRQPPIQQASLPVEEALPLRTPPRPEHPQAAAEPPVEPPGTHAAPPAPAPTVQRAALPIEAAMPLRAPPVAQPDVPAEAPEPGVRDADGSAPAEPADIQRSAQAPEPPLPLHTPPRMPSPGTGVPAETLAQPKASPVASLPTPIDVPAIQRQRERPTPPEASGDPGQTEARQQPPPAVIQRQAEPLDQDLPLRTPPARPAPESAAPHGSEPRAELSTQAPASIFDRDDSAVAQAPPAFRPTTLEQSPLVLRRPTPPPVAPLGEAGRRIAGAAATVAQRQALASHPRISEPAGSPSGEASAVAPAAAVPPLSAAALLELAQRALDDSAPVLRRARTEPSDDDLPLVPPPTPGPTTPEEPAPSRTRQRANAISEPVSPLVVPPDKPDPAEDSSSTAKNKTGEESSEGEIDTSEAEGIDWASLMASTAAPAVDLDDLARRIYPIIRRMLAVERERR